VSRLTSSFTCQLISVVITSTTLVIHHSTLLLKDQILPFQQILPTLTLLLYPWTAFTIMGPDWTGLMLVDLFFITIIIYLFSKMEN